MHSSEGFFKVHTGDHGQTNGDILEKELSVGVGEAEDLFIVDGEVDHSDEKRLFVSEFVYVHLFEGWNFGKRNYVYSFVGVFIFPDLELRVGEVPGPELRVIGVDYTEIRGSFLNVPHITKCSK